MENEDFLLHRDLLAIFNDVPSENKIIEMIKNNLNHLNNKKNKDIYKIVLDKINKKCFSTSKWNTTFNELKNNKILYIDYINKIIEEELNQINKNLNILKLVINTTNDKNNKDLLSVYNHILEYRKIIYNIQSFFNIQ
jgi:hypothetical protein